jgi:hypothetical protein
MPRGMYQTGKTLHLGFLCSLIKVEGDIVECGVGYGNSLKALATFSEYENKGRKVYGFDTFKSFPPREEGDEEPHKSYVFATKDKVRKFVGNIPKFVVGSFEDTVPNYEGKIALLNLDCDYYSSYKVCLENLLEKVVVGGVIAFDEYNSKKWKSANKAIEEYIDPKEIKKSPVMDKYYWIKK